MSAIHLSSSVAPGEALRYAELAGDDSFLAGYEAGRRAAQSEADSVDDDLRLELEDSQDRCFELEHRLDEVRDLLLTLADHGPWSLRTVNALRSAAAGDSDAIEEASRAGPAH